MLYWKQLKWKKMLTQCDNRREKLQAQDSFGCFARVTEYMAFFCVANIWYTTRSRSIIKGTV